MRLRTIRYKDGRAPLTVLHNRPAPNGENDWRGKLIENAKAIAELGEEDSALCGYVVLGIYADGKTSLGFRYDSRQRHSIPRTMIPSWIAEVVRRDIVAGPEARAVFDDMFQWVE